MAEEDPSQERTEEPTAKRLRESREQGQIARSKDFNIMMSLAFAALGLLVFGDQMGEALSNLMRDSLQIAREKIFDPGFMVTSFWQRLTDAILAIVPFLVLTVLAAMAGPMLLGGWSFSTKVMQPKLDKLSPLKGLKRMFGMNGLVELLKSLLKFVLLGGISYFTFIKMMPGYLNLGQNTAEQGIAEGYALILWQFIALVAGLLVVASLDMPYQLISHKKKIMMTLQQVRDESKETDGRPEVKSRIRQLQYQMSQNRMLKDVPEANVILVNPTHYAVALKYDADGATAPVLVAKGVDLVAFKIREIAEAHNVAIFTAPPLTRALYYTTEIGKEIPSDLYLAVARVLAYLYQLNNLKRGTRAQAPGEDDLPIPDDYKALTRKQAKWNKRD